VQGTTLARKGRGHVPFCRQIVQGQLFMALDSPCGDKRPGAEVDATVGGTGVIEIAPELAVRQQVHAGTSLNGVGIREVGESAGEREYWRTWRQILRGEHCLTMRTCP
jgi:hypothetical protein